ncbi:hypothetical protein GCM10010430_56070 [Kitasatospora cystarginea]|uniref:Secreted protein n=1 Tax=Kitasatospora cystarginea TaxID=58350 RepID=A0ABN3END6_9ACTN
MVQGAPELLVILRVAAAGCASLAWPEDWRNVTEVFLVVQAAVTPPPPVPEDELPPPLVLVLPPDGAEAEPAAGAEAGAEVAPDGAADDALVPTALSCVPLPSLQAVRDRASVATAPTASRAGRVVVRMAGSPGSRSWVAILHEVVSPYTN